jgi:hypothetical protein
MIESPPTPIWLKLTKAMIGLVIAAIVFIVGLLWRDRIERRNAAQAWFENTYITDGIDLLMLVVSYISSKLEIRLVGV